MKEQDIISIMATILYCFSRHGENIETALEKAIEIYDGSVIAKDHLG